MKKISITFLMWLLLVMVYAQKPKLVNVLDYGFDETDATECIQKAIDSHASRVIVPNIGRPYIVRPLFARSSDQEIFFEPGVILQAKKGEFRDRDEVLLKISGVKNVKLSGYGATFRMNKKDYQDSSQYKRSEWRHALFITTSIGQPTENISVRGLHFEKSGGDGIYVGGTVDNTTKIPYQPVGVLVEDVVCADNHRQGFSITGAESLKIVNSVFIDTKGTDPQAGIDWEPNSNAMVDLEMTNCLFINNLIGGVALWLWHAPESGPVGMQLTLNDIHVDSDPGVQDLSTSIGYIDDNNGYTGTITYNDCSFRNSTGKHIVYITMKSALRARVIFNRCLFEQKDPKGKVISLSVDMRDVKDKMTFGGIDFNNCIVNDNYDRPFITFTDHVGTGKGIRDIQGKIKINNPFGAKMILGDQIQNIGLQVSPVLSRAPEVRIIEPSLLRIYRSGDKYRFSAEASDPDAGSGNGQGIEQVIFTIRKGERIITSGIDRVAPYEISGKMTGWEPGIYLLKATVISSEFGSTNLKTTAFEIMPEIKRSSQSIKKMKLTSQTN